MVNREPIDTRNLDGYGTPPIPWSAVSEILDTQHPQAPDTGGPNRHTTWLTTINPDGRPHVTPVGVMADGGSWYFTSGSGTRKSRNIARDDRCTISVATHPFDLVVEGTAQRVTAPTELERVAAAFRDDGWPASVEGDALTAEFSAPSAGPAPWQLYRLAPSTVFAFGTEEPYGATRFDITARRPDRGSAR